MKSVVIEKSLDCYATKEKLKEAQTLKFSQKSFLSRNYASQMVLDMFSNYGFSAEDRIKESHRLGSDANVLVKNGCHMKAIELYSRAIRLNPTDHRFYLNKALCLEALGFLEEALSDIEASILLIPDSGKPYLRKAEILRQLKHYKEAEILLNSVLVSKLDVDTEAVLTDILTLRKSALTSYGFDKESVEEASHMCCSISDAVEYIIKKKMGSVKICQTPKSYADVAKSSDSIIKNGNHSSCNSMDEIKPSSPSVAFSSIPQPSKRSPTCITPPKMQSPLPREMSDDNRCTNLVGYKGLWVGNVSRNCKHEDLVKLFQKYGTVNIHQLKRAPCIFAKYNNAVSPVRAIEDLYGKVMEDMCEDPRKPLNMHFDCNQDQLKDKFPKDRKPRNFPNGECYFWRTVGCPLGDTCPKRHVPINEKIDFQMWMVEDKYHKNFILH